MQYVFVDPEHHDIVLAGPADGWVVDALGDVVGRTNHQPVMQLDDLLVALRTADAARNGGVSCSINPTPEGIKRFQEFIRQQKTIGDPQRTLASIEESIGPAEDHAARRARCEPVRLGHGRGRFPHEAAGDEFRACAGQRFAELSGNDSGRRRKCRT